MTRFGLIFAVAALACRPAAPRPPAPVPDAATTAPAARTAPSPTAPQLAMTVAREPAVIAAIVDEGLRRSRVEADLRYLTDVIGPRLTGTPAMRRANEWAVQKFRDYGADSAWVEPWPFGRGWERGPMTLRMLAPHARWLHGVSWGWSPGTGGPVAGDVHLVDARSAAEFRQRFGGKLRGAWVMTRAPLPRFDPATPRPTAADTAALQAARRAVVNPERSDEERAFREALADALAAEGIAGLVHSGDKEYALLTMSGSPLSISVFPQLVVPHETYAMFARLLAAGETVRIEANIANMMTDRPLTAYNTVAEIRGSERPDEVVLLGAHLDSWDLGTGATDNASGSVAVLEAARILRAANARPRRTIRFALFSGEEQGLFGSGYYALAHRAQLARYQAVLVLDNGTGRITGMALQGRDELADLWRQLFAAVDTLGPFHVRRGTKGGTDHLSFLPYRVPSFNYDQASRGYDYTHHSQVDTFDHAVVGDVRQAATVIAATAYQLANLTALLPRNPAGNRE